MLVLGPAGPGDFPGQQVQLGKQRRRATPLYRLGSSCLRGLSPSGCTSCAQVTLVSPSDSQVPAGATRRTGTRVERRRMCDYPARTLRAASMDEFPTLWNVTPGHIFLVSPRPSRVTNRERYNGAQARWHEVRRDLTCLAPASGRNVMTWESKLALDGEYIDRRSAQMDWKTLLRSVRCVLRRGAVAKSQATTSTSSCPNWAIVDVKCDRHLAP